MLRFIKAISFTLVSLLAIAQEVEERDYVFLTFEFDRNKDMHGTYIFYWIAELEKNQQSDEFTEPDIYPIFLTEFYGNDQLESCCADQLSYPYTFTTNTNFDFPPNYSEHLSELRNLVKENRIKLQSIKKTWKENYKETITVYGTALRGRLCKCKFGGDRILAKGIQISFPSGDFKVLGDYWENESNPLFFYDFSEFEYDTH